MESWVSRYVCPCFYSNGTTLEENEASCPTVLNSHSELEKKVEKVFKEHFLEEIQCGEPVQENGKQVEKVNSFQEKQISFYLEQDASSSRSIDEMFLLEEEVCYFEDFDFSPLRILIADDEEFCFQIVEEILNENGICQVQCAKDGQTAAEMAKTNQYDLIFMDIGMPHLSGDEAANQIRKYPHSEKLVILGLSGDESLYSGMDDMLTKPISEKQVKQCLITYFGESCKRE